MEVLWKEGDITAKQIANILSTEIGWNQNTTYTVIKKCVAKGVIERKEPHFICHALLSKNQVQAAETQALLGRMFDGSPELLFATLLSSQTLSPEQIENLRKTIERLK